MSTTTTSWILELVDRVTAPLRTIQRAGASVYDTIDKVNGRITQLQAHSTELTKRLKGLTITAGAFVLLSAGSVQFEEGMARANTMAEVGASQLEAYKNQIQDIATIAPIAKTQLAEGLYNTISAGVPKDNWITFLNDSTKASIAGNAQLGTVVEATASTIKAYGDSFDTASKVQDRFQKTVQLGQIPSLEALASALPRVTAVSSKLKLSQEELLGVFATASGVMGQPAEVATQLNAVLAAMLKPSAEATKQAEKLGIALNANSIAKAGGLQNYITQLMPKIQAFAEQTGTTQEEIIGNLFGSQEAIKLVIGLGGELASSWATNTTAVSNATGSVQRGFNIMAQTTTSQMQLMRNSFGNLMDNVVGVLGPFVTILLQVSSAVLNIGVEFMRSNPTFSKFVIIGGTAVFMAMSLTTAITLVSVRLNLMHARLLRAALSSNAFTAGMAKATLAVWNFVRAGASQLVLLSGQAAGYLLAGAYMLGSFIVGLVSATAAQWGLNVAMYANPIGLIVLGIVAAIGVIVLLVKYWDNIKQAILKFSAWIQKNNPFEWMVTLIDKVFPGFREKIEALKEWVKNLLLGVWESIKKVWTGIKEFFGFGDDTTVEVEVTKKPNGPDPTGFPNPELPQVDLNGKKPTATGPDTPTVTGTGGGGKSLVMNLEITNNFHMAAGNWKGQVEDIANELVGKINDRLRDGAIALN